jgi:nicotinate dehydrogenase subunit B
MGELMRRFVEEADRGQRTLLPECLDDFIDESNPVRVIDVFVEALDLAEMSFEGVEPAATGWPSYHPSVLLKLYIYGYLNRVQSSRRLEREAGRNVEVMWLLGRLAPDHKTIADFRKDNGLALRKVCARFVELCREMGLLATASVAIDRNARQSMKCQQNPLFPVVRAEELQVRNGTIIAADGRRATFWELAKDSAGLLKGDIALAAAPKKPSDYAIVGKSVNRIDLPGKLTGAPSYVQDIRLPGMVFARVVRPPRYGARLLAFDEAAVRALPGVVAVISDGNFLAVAARREEQAIAARDALASSAHWSGDAAELPDMARLHTELQKLRAETIVVGSAGQSEPAPGQTKRVSAEYSRAYLSHAAIGPSCAVAWLKDGRMTVWSHTQGAFPLRGDLAKVLGMQNGEVDVVHVPGAGCYGHNGADDVALDAALVARAVPGAPVKLQWMRDDEFAWAPFGPAMAMKVEAALGPDGRIVDWSYDVWSNSHAMRPGQPGGVNLLAAWDLKTPFVKSPAPHIPQPFGDGDRNAVPSYELPRKEIRNHLLLDAPVRNGSFRTLGAHGNIFAIESFMDELAEAAGSDPLAFRLAHLRDPRAQAVLQAAADKAGWAPGKKGDGQRGRGLA